MNIELNTAELNILHDAVRTLLRDTAVCAMEEDSQATGAELEAKLIEALKNARVAAKAATLATV
jgi:hypothetical protein